MSYALQLPARQFTSNLPVRDFTSQLAELSFVRPEVTPYIKGKSLYSNGFSYIKPTNQRIFNNTQSFIVEVIAKRDELVGANDFSSVILQFNYDDFLASKPHSVLGIGFIRFFGIWNLFGMLTLGNDQAINSPDSDMTDFNYFVIAYNHITNNISIFKNGEYASGGGEGQGGLDFNDVCELFIGGGDDRIIDFSIPLKKIWFDELKIYVIDELPDDITLAGLVQKNYKNGLFYYGAIERDNLTWGCHFDTDYNFTKVFDFSRNRDNGIITNGGVPPYFEYDDGATKFTDVVKKSITIKQTL